MSSPFFTDEHGMSSGVRFTSEDIPCLPFKVSVFSAMIFEISARKIALRPRFHATFGLRLNRCIKQIDLPVHSCPILLDTCTCMIADRIGLHSVFLKL